MSGTGQARAGRKPKGWVALAGFGLALTLVALRQYVPELVEVSLGTPQGPSADGLVIAQLSDLHLRDWRDLVKLDRALKLVEQAEPDAVVLTGDYVLGSPEALYRAVPHLKRLHAPLGVYAVLGNHDVWTDREIVSDALRQSGIIVLDNEGRELWHGQTALYLAGLDDGWSGTPDVSAALEANTKGLPVVMLLHEPDLGHEIVQEGGAWLLLAGHSHGGQVRLPGIGALVVPDYARRYQQGLYRVGDGWIYVNRGIGTAELRLRLGCRPEVTVLTLYPPTATGQAEP